MSLVVGGCAQGGGEAPAASAGMEYWMDTPSPRGFGDSCWGYNSPRGCAAGGEGEEMTCTVMGRRGGRLVPADSLLSDKSEARHVRWMEAGPHTHNHTHTAPQTCSGISPAAKAAFCGHRGLSSVAELS